MGLYLNVWVRGLVRVTLCVLVLFTLTACDRADPVEEGVKGVNEVLVLREKAIESKDLALYKSLISEGYSESGVTADLVIADIERLFSKDGAIEYEYQKARPSISMNSARVIHMIEYKFVDSGESAKAQEKLYLRKINGKWLISGGVVLGLAR